MGSEFGSFPVGKSLAFGNAASENDGENLLKRVVGDAELLGVVLKFDEAVWVDFAGAGYAFEVVVDREPDFSYGRIADEVFECVGEAEFVEPEKETEIVGGELHQGDFVGSSFSE